MKNMDKKLKKQKSNTKDYYNDPANKWLREYLEQNNTGYGDKVNSDKDFAKRCDIKYSRIKSMTGGKSAVHSNDIIAFYKATGITPNEILLGNDYIKTLKKDIPEVNDAIEINVFKKEFYNVIYKHCNSKNKLFEVKDNFLSFLEYLVCDEIFLKTLSEKSNKILEEIKQDIKNGKIEDKEIMLLVSNDDCIDVKKIQNNQTLNDKYKEIITDKKIRNEIRDIIIKYVCYKLNNKKF